MSRTLLALVAISSGVFGLALGTGVLSGGAPGLNDSSANARYSGTGTVFIDDAVGGVRQEGLLYPAGSSAEDPERDISQDGVNTPPSDFSSETSKSYREHGEVLSADGPYLAESCRPDGSKICGEFGVFIDPEP